MGMSTSNRPLETKIVHVQKLCVYSNNIALKITLIYIDSNLWRELFHKPLYSLSKPLIIKWIHSFKCRPKTDCRDVMLTCFYRHARDTLKEPVLTKHL